MPVIKLRKKKGYIVQRCSLHRKGAFIAMRKMLPIGIDGFEKVRKNNFYFVDKSMFIADLLQNWGEVNLFTRPRRFGKSLNMSMLKAFFEIGADRELFDGLKIVREKELCEAYMGKFPVISITLKSVDGLTYQSAYQALRYVIGLEASRFAFLKQSDKLTEDEKNKVVFAFQRKVFLPG